MKTLVTRCFTSFFEHQITKYTKGKDYKVHTVGSIGFVYKEVFAKVASAHGFKIGNVIKSPMEGLIEFHSAN
jgi:hypothetical protein